MKKVGIIECGSKKCQAITDCVKEAGFETQSIQLRQANQFDFTRVESVIISGGPHLFTESPDKYQQLMTCFSFIKQLTIPTLGICLGHQAIALTLGSKVYRGAERRKSDQLNVLIKHPLFDGLPTHPEFAEDHCEGIQPCSNLHLLASSKHYPVEAFAAKNKPFFGVQFHPEISGKTGWQLIVNFLNISPTTIPD